MEFIDEVGGPDRRQLEPSQHLAEAHRLFTRGVVTGDPPGDLASRWIVALRAAG